MNSTTPILLAPIDLPRGALQQCREQAQALAYALQEPVGLAMVDDEFHAQVGRQLEQPPADGYRRPMTLVEPVKPNPMSSAPFVYKDDGTPNWAVMWESFCELALYGGPPHRGDDAALTAPAGFGAPVAGFDAIAEIQRGIWETSGLRAEPSSQPGWLAVTCGSPKMAAWLCATILLENVEARCEGDKLLLPAAADFELKNQVKSVITVVAKTNHYWQAHLARERR